MDRGITVCVTFDLFCSMRYVTVSEKHALSKLALERVSRCEVFHLLNEVPLIELT